MLHFFPGSLFSKCSLSLRVIFMLWLNMMSDDRNMKAVRTRLGVLTAGREGTFALTPYHRNSWADYCQASNYSPLKANIFFSLSAPIPSIPWSSILLQEWDNQGKYRISLLNATCFLFNFINMPGGILPYCNSTLKPQNKQGDRLKNLTPFCFINLSSSFHSCHVIDFFQLYF